MARFAEPEKRINQESDLANFKHLLAYKRLHHVIAFILDRVQGVEVPRGFLDPLVSSRNQTGPLRSDLPSFGGPFRPSEEAQRIIDILDNMARILRETPPLEGPRRFGNFAFRDWSAKLKKEAGPLLDELCGSPDFSRELQFYLLGSFGSAIRLDYGTGHELSFIAFFGGLVEYEKISGEILGENILVIFAKYYDLVRSLIVTYNLEPAGSHGVWGLDDHFHFLYILGAAEFNLSKEQKKIKFVPLSLLVMTAQTIGAYKETNMYVNSIAFVHKIKHGPFSEHSPMLFDISQSVAKWEKVLSGLLKMYEVEVFGKFPVVQHFYFGPGLYPWQDAETAVPLPYDKVSPDEHDDSEDQDKLRGLTSARGLNPNNMPMPMTSAPWARPRFRPGNQAGSSFRGPPGTLRP